MKKETKNDNNIEVGTDETCSIDNKKKLMNQYIANDQDEKAVPLMSELAELGDIDACCAAAALYVDEDAGVEGVKQDIQKAFGYAIVAAKAGLTDAQSMVGMMYLDGDGVEKDISQAILWLEKAASKGDIVPIVGLADLYKSQGNKDKALFWYKKGAKLGDVCCQKILASSFFEGEFFPYNRKEALKYYLILAHNKLNTPQYFDREHCLQSIGEAAEAVSEILFYGQGVKKDYKKAFYYAKKSADYGSEKSQNLVAQMYKEGKGVPKDLGAYMEYLSKSASQKNIDAIYVLATEYKKQKNNEQALYWFSLGDKKKDVGCQLSLASAYNRGTFVPQDKKKAVYFLKKILFWKFFFITQIKSIFVDFFFIAF